MAKNFINRLREYYVNVAEVLRGEADAASIFPNPTDVGMSREKVYMEFLKQHAPSKCNVFLGGFIFDDDGIESKQLDIIITTDTTLRFNFNNPDGSGKSFSHVEGTLGVVSVKTNLDKNGLFDALSGIASIPKTKSLERRVSPIFNISDYEDWPLKIVYATSGLSFETLLNHINDFYVQNPAIPVTRRPNLIHVLGKYLIVRVTKELSIARKQTGAVPKISENQYYVLTADSDLQSIIITVDQLQRRAAESSHILFSYGDFINKALDSN